jgi:nucleotide-binding universal stress UspA family protein
MTEPWSNVWRIEMYRIVVPVDGSDVALKAVSQAVRVARLIGDAEVHLVNVQPPISGSVGAFVGSDNVAGFYRDESENALAAARKVLEAEGLPVKATMRIGSAGEEIAAFAHELPADEIVMGTRGLGRISSLVLGSTATEVVHLAEVPVTLVK